MCGIAGFTRNNKLTDMQCVHVLNSMQSSIQYRGPDQQGHYINDHICLAHNRLAILDLMGGKQPCIDITKKEVLIFNGEIYNFKTLKNELSHLSVFCRDHSDTEVLYQCLCTLGVEVTLQKIRGMFAFAFYDAEGTLTLARDHFGEKPLYYSIQGSSLIFGSEIKTILQHPSCQSAHYNKAAIAHYLALEYSPAEETCYQNIYRLKPGHYIQYAQNNQYVIKQYWQPEHTSKTFLNNDSLLYELELLLTNSIKEKMIADVPLGLFLSGGLDSSLICALASKTSNNINAYTIKMPEHSFDESLYAKQVADYLNIPLNVIELTNNDISQAFSELYTFLDEPFSDSSMLPSYLLCKSSRNSIKVALGGDGADELFAGYPNFYALGYSTIMQKTPTFVGKYLQKTLGALPATSKYMSKRFKLKQLCNGFGKPALEQSFYWMSAWTPDEQMVLWNQEHRAILKSQVEKQFQEYTQSLYNLESLPSLNKLQQLFLNTYLPNDILFKMDRASMFNSLEVRSPFLSTDIAKFALSIPPTQKLQGKSSKWILKKLAYKYLPPSCIERRKHGFALPISELIRTSLRREFEETLLSPPSQFSEWFRLDTIHSMLGQHINRKHDNGKKLLTLYQLAKFVK